MPASSSGLGLRLLWRPMGFSLDKCVFTVYAYKLSLKVSSKCIHPNYYFYCFECVHRVCPNLSSAPCILFQNLFNLTIAAKPLADLTLLQPWSLSQTGPYRSHGAEPLADLALPKPQSLLPI